MNWFDERKRAERREAVVLVVYIVVILVVGLGVLQLAGWPW